MGNPEAEMKKSIVFALLCILTGGLFAQQLTLAQKEKLSDIPVGEGTGRVRFIISEEGFYSPGGVFVDQRGGLFFIQNSRVEPIIRYQNGRFLEIPIPPNIPDSWFGPSSFGISQNGLSGSGSFFFMLDDDSTYKQTNIYNKHYMKPVLASSYLTPWGSIWESIDQKMLVSAEFGLGGSVILRNLEETKKWLLTQPGGFSIGIDGHLYRNGILWSAIKPSGIAGLFVGRLASGHTIWDAGDTLYIVNSRQKIEAKIDIPWAHSDSPNGGYVDHGVGPWGELYYLIPPPYIPTGEKRSDHGGGFNDVYKFDETKPAELVVVRNHLKYFGRLNDSNVRLRKDPSTSADILGTYPAKTGFCILETGTKKETIGGQKNVWYKVRLLDGNEGWFFGSFVQNLYDGPNGTPPPWPNVADW
jgi:hypothetical protein